MSEQNLRADDIDRLGQALITVTRELWVVKDRLRVLEAALADAGIITPDAVDSFKPDEALQEVLGKERAHLINEVLGTLESSADS